MGYNGKHSEFKVGGARTAHRVILIAVLAVTFLVLPAFPPAASAANPVSATRSCPDSSACTLPSLSSAATSSVQGVVTSCASASSCDFVFNVSGVLGWANASPPSMSLRLPGEALTSTGLSYSTYTASLTGTYTYWTVGNFVGTDVNTGKVVYGTTNTNSTITCYGHSGRDGGCTYIYTTDNGTIVVHLTQADQTATTVACVPSTIAPGSATVCTATVNDTVNATSKPSGNVSFAGAYGSTANFSSGGLCTLVAGSCSVTYTAPDDQLGTVPITATFLGTPSYYTSGGRSSIYVTTSASGGGNSTSTVNFTETGLAVGTAWSVTFGGLRLSSTNATVTFEVQNGSYAFTVGSVPGYFVAPTAGNITVVGDDVGLNVSFSTVAYPMTFNAAGLPSGKPWTVTVDGTVYRSTNSSISINATNGTHSYLVRGPAGYRVSGAAPFGDLTVTGVPQSASFTFVKGPSYAVVFVERGLPTNTTWCLRFVSVTCSSTHALRFANLTPAQYAYSVLPMVGQVVTAKIGPVSIPLLGNLSLVNHSLRVVLHYVYPYVVTFTETGLPNGTAWSVTIAGVTHNSTAPSITFELGNGTHPFRIGAITGYVHSALPTSARVLGGPATVTVTFRA